MYNMQSNITNLEFEALTNNETGRLLIQDYQQRTNMVFDNEVLESFFFGWLLTVLLRFYR